MASPASQSADLQSTLQILVYYDSCMLAGATSVLYEHMITLSQEIETMWKSRLTSASIIFFMNRYTMLVWSISSIVLQLPYTRNSPARYGSMLMFWGSLNIIWYGVWAGFGALRVYAVGGRNWPLAIITLLLALVPVCTNAYTYAMTLPQSSKRLSIPGDEVPASLSNKLVIVTHVCLISSDVLVICVTWMSMLKLKRAAGSNARVASLIRLLGRDGTLHFLIVLLLNCLQMGLWETDTSSVVAVLITPLSSIIVSRFLLGLRQLHLGPGAESDASEDPASSLSGDIELSESEPSSASISAGYLSTFVGSMGTPLNDPVWSRVYRSPAGSPEGASQAHASGSNPPAVVNTAEDMNDTRV